MLLQLPAQSVDLLIDAALITLHPAAYQLLYSSPSPAPTPTSSVHISVMANSSRDPAITAAIIGAAASLVAALIAVGIAIYQIRQSHKAEHEKVELQLHHDQEMERFRRELDMQYHEKEQRNSERKLHGMRCSQHKIMRPELLRIVKRYMLIHRSHAFRFSTCNAL